MLLKSSIKYNLLSKDELIINLDRLSRFKLPEDTFFRVFSSVILKCLIYPKYSKKDILLEDFNVISDIVKEIWNNSVKNIYSESKMNLFANNVLKSMIYNTFKEIDERTSVLINTELNISPVLEQINYDTAPLNLKFLIKANELKENISLQELREKYSLCFPLTKLIIVEGITEEILLPVFADMLKYNFNQKGIYILGAGGKSKSPSLYLTLKNRLKIPIVLLFDEDAKEMSASLDKILAKKDKYIIIEHGEFEDILSENLIKRTLNTEYKLSNPITINELRIFKNMCKNIENFFKTRHLGEFKKSKFAKMLAANLKYQTDISDDIKNLFNKITQKELE